MLQKASSGSDVCSLHLMGNGDLTISGLRGFGALQLSAGSTPRSRCLAGRNRFQPETASPQLGRLQPVNGQSGKQNIFFEILLTRGGRNALWAKSSTDRTELRDRDSNGYAKQLWDYLFLME
jgi:hypothetical protein